MEQKLLQQIDELLYLTLESVATDEQVAQLNAYIQSDAEIQRYVIEYYYVTAALHKTNAIPTAFFETSNEVNEQYNLLLALGQEEINAPVLEVPEESEELGTSGIVNIEKARRKVNKMAYVTAIVSIAALLIMIAYIRAFPPKESVAVLIDSIDATWQNSSEQYAVGHQFHNTDVPVLLRSGVVEIEFGYGAKAVIEGPAEFACKSNNQINLNYGRLYARVPEQSTGFTVETTTSRIVDLGTEFGVQANIDQTTELHVMKGRTKLLSGEDSVYDVLAGQAREVLNSGHSVESVSLKKKTFIRHIYSKSGLMIKQSDIRLADIVGGGNGFGTGQAELSINPMTAMNGPVESVDRVANNAYHPMLTSPFIDGVFIPNGQTEQVISSSGHIFAGCPETKGNYYTGLVNTPKFINNTEVIFDGVNYAIQNEDASCLFMHANLGITFDLQAIRKQIPDIRLTRFQSKIGISDSSPRQCNADFWVLVDGRLCYKKEGLKQKGTVEFVNIELPENARFLTLITTDGGDSNLRPVGMAAVESIDSDWCLFADPILLLE